MARQRLREVHIFLEVLLNLTLLEEATKLDMVVCCTNGYIDGGAWVPSCPQWINEGNEGCKFYFDFLKQKVVAERVLGLCWVDGSLAEDPVDDWTSGPNVQGSQGTNLSQLIESLTTVTSVRVPMHFRL